METIILLLVMVSVPALLFQAVKKRALKEKAWQAYAGIAAFLFAGMIAAKLFGLI